MADRGGWVGAAGDGGDPQHPAVRVQPRADQLDSLQPAGRRGRPAHPHAAAAPRGGPGPAGRHPRPHGPAVGGRRGLLRLARPGPAHPAWREAPRAQPGRQDRRQVGSPWRRHHLAAEQGSEMAKKDGKNL